MSLRCRSAVGIALAAILVVACEVHRPTAAVAAVGSSVQVGHRFVSGGTRADAAANPRVVRRSVQPSSDGASMGLVSVPRRAIVTFTVRDRTDASLSFDHYPRSAGAYYAYYLPRFKVGAALLPDPGSDARWPATLALANGNPSPIPELLPGTTYRMLVAVSRPSKVPVPFPMEISSVHRTSFPVRAIAAPLAVPPGITAVGATDDRLGRLPLSAYAIGIDLPRSAVPISAGGGQACPTQARSVRCAAGSNGGFGSGMEDRGAAQMVYGEDYDHPVPAPQIVGYVYNAPGPFESAALYGFAFAPPSMVGGWHGMTR
jgi:hypothetical protein